ncbi:MAG: hydrogenase formation protein HypD [Firmicutes bacterium]|nr:hydrogenase formation protein HypD [Bacillota bacterium]
MKDLWPILTSYRSPQLVHKMVHAIETLVQEKIEIMQVCGTHTWSYRRHGLDSLLPSHLSLLAGPGCPVCVTDQEDIDWVINLAQERQNTLVTFGDIMRVPGSTTSLAELRSRGTDIQIALSPLKALDIALSQPSRRVILVALGFETTVPAIAATLQSAHRLGLGNLSVALLLKQLLPALRHLFNSTRPDGLLCPGHVATITGKDAFAFLPKELDIPAAIAGFEPVDILMGLAELARQISAGAPQIANTYPRAVSDQGNLTAQSLVRSTFAPAPTRWRGLGTLDGTGYRLIGRWQRFAVTAPTDALTSLGTSQCLCHLVILGKAQPEACLHFGTECTPTRPLGPCMVSEEGTCAAHYYFPLLKPMGRTEA